MIEDGNSKYDVGYGKPPRRTQFKPGKSGYPAGRPRKNGLTFPESFLKELKRTVRITEGGKSRSTTKREAIVLQLINRAMGGDLKAAALIMSALELNGSNQSDKLTPILSALRGMHAKHELMPKKPDPEREESGSSAPAGSTEEGSQDD